MNTPKDGRGRELFTFADSIMAGRTDFRTTKDPYLTAVTTEDPDGPIDPVVEHTN